MLLPVLILRMKSKLLFLDSMNCQDLALAHPYNLISHQSSLPHTVVQPHTYSSVCASDTSHSFLSWWFHCCLLVFLWLGSFYHWDFISNIFLGRTSSSIQSKSEIILFCVFIHLLVICKTCPSIYINSVRARTWSLLFIPLSPRTVRTQ